MALLTLSDLQSINTDPQFISFQVPNPDPTKTDNVEVRIKLISSSAYIDLINSLTDENGKPIKWRSGHLGELMVAKCLVNEDGKRIMKDEDIKEPWWKNTAPAFMTTIIAKVREACKVSVVGEGVAEEVKNSEAETDSAD